MKLSSTCIFLLIIGPSLAFGQALHQSRDLTTLFSPQTLSQWTVSIQANTDWRLTGDAESCTALSFGIGLGQYIDLLSGYRIGQETDDTIASFGVKIGDPPFLGHHLGLLPSVSVPLNDDRAQAIYGLRFMHVIEPEWLTVPTKFYVNYGYFWRQRRHDEVELQTHDEFIDGGAAIKWAFRRTVFMSEFGLQSPLDFDQQSFSESKFQTILGVRIPLKWAASLKLHAAYHFSHNDPATAYQPDENTWTFGLSFTRVIFPANANREKLKSLYVESIDPATDHRQVHQLKMRQQLTANDIEALRQLMSAQAYPGGK